jgi:1,4-alpha-glucan branching enzyme
MAIRSTLRTRLETDLRRIAEGRHHDPHGVLGLHESDGGACVLLHIPSAKDVRIDGRLEAQRMDDTDFFAWSGARGEVTAPYRTSWTDGSGTFFEQYDPYAFPSLIDPGELEAWSGGRHHAAWHFLGAHVMSHWSVQGVRFAVWAPDAERVSVVGPFCRWDGRRYPMRVLGSSGVWEIFIPGLGAGELYKFEIRNRATGALLLKSDPCARASELRPDTASIVASPEPYAWTDSEWLTRRSQRDWLHAPMSIYEVHLASWRRRPDGGFLNYRELADQLAPYVQRLGFTHVELLPIAEHPLDDSWGYQTTGHFAPTSRHGSPNELRYFIDTLHRHGIGVLLDWVPAHFPRDAHGLANFDGTALYEYADARKAEHKDWGTLVFNYERNEVRAFLLSSACYWLEQFHFDGLRVDAVASMLYLDFSKRGGEFVPNRHGGNQNLEAVEFLRELNAVTHASYPGTVTIAEESTDWPMVSRPTSMDGLGFSMKWNMGWMHDTLEYLSEDPIHRQHHHNRLTFAMTYAYSENFVLPLSHDEVVHLKRSLLGKMPGDRWQQFANLRLLLTYQWTFPGKKLLFMGSELAQPTEWDFRNALPWHLLDDPAHAGVQRLLADLNRLYVEDPGLHRLEFEPGGFQWVDPNDREHSVFSYLRSAGDRHVLVVLNFTPVPRHNWRVGVPARPTSGRYREALNSDSTHYGGSNVGNLTLVDVQTVPCGGLPCSVVLNLPPLAAVVLTAAS